MTRENLAKRAEIINGRSGALEAVGRRMLQASKQEQTKGVQLMPAVKHKDRIATLQTVFGEEGVVFVDGDRKLHGKDILASHLGCPDIIVYPEKVEQIQWLCGHATEYSIPLIPYGLGSSIQGNTCALQGGICIDMSRMNRVLEFNPEDRIIRVQAGLTKNALADYLMESTLFLPIEIGNCDASVGGMIATNANGSLSAAYGCMKDCVLGLKVVTAAGELISTGRQALCSATGFQLGDLFVGAEGTLGVVVEATLKLVPIPKAISCAIASFDTLENALNTANNLYRQAISVQRCEIIDAQTIKTLNAYHSTEFPAHPTLFLEAHGSNRAAADSVIEECKDICREGGLIEYLQFTDEESGPLPMLWTGKSTIWTSTLHANRGQEIMVLDVAVPPSRLKDLVGQALHSALQYRVSWSSSMCNIGLGTFTMLLPAKSNDREAINAAKTFINRVHEQVLRLDGTCSAQYGIGCEKREELERELGKEAIIVMRHLKRTLDPKNILNPGKLFAFID